MFCKLSQEGKQNKAILVIDVTYSNQQIIFLRRLKVIIRALIICQNWPACLQMQCVNSAKLEELLMTKLFILEVTLAKNSSQFGSISGLAAVTNGEMPETASVQFYNIYY